MINEIQFKQATGMSPGDLLTYGLILLAVLVTVYATWKILRGRSKQTVAVPPALDVQVTGLGTAGPPPGPPVLEYYHYPVRLAAIVLAPAGRTRELPPLDKLGGLVDLLVPGLRRSWPCTSPWSAAGRRSSASAGSPTASSFTRGCPARAARARPGARWPACSAFDNQPVMAGLVLLPPPT